MKKRLLERSVFALACAVMVLRAGLVAAAEKDFTKETPQEKRDRLAWFRDARFGMFIHWGLYAVPAGEWKGFKDCGEWFLEDTRMPVSEYEKYAQQFRPDRFDAAAWVRIAKSAGMRYVVITGKHHDGFAMYRSEFTEWCMKSTPFPRDPLKELAAACKAEGLAFGVYYSIMDWHHPDWGRRRAWNDRAAGTPDMDRYVTFMKSQLRELVCNYGPLGVLWFDGEWEEPWTRERGVDLYNYVRSLQPDIIVNNRIGKGRSGMQGMDKEGQGVGDFGTPEQEIPDTGFGPDTVWESCMTINNHWGYNKYDQNWKSAKTLIRNLVECASKGGNFLLNVGPTSEGQIPAPSVERLAAVGAWLKVNGEAIYGTTAGPLKRQPWGCCTQKAPGGAPAQTHRLYLHIFEWPSDGVLAVPLANKVLKAYLLADRGRLLDSSAGERGGLTLALPTSAPDENASVVVLETEGELRAAGE